MLSLLLVLLVACVPSEFAATVTPIVKIVYVTATPAPGTPQPPTLNPTITRTLFITRTPVTPKPTATFPLDRIVNCEQVFPNHVSGPVSPHGITPGSTTIEEVEQILGPADWIREDPIFWEYDPNKDRDDWVYIQFDAENVVFEILYSSVERLTFKTFFEEYGCPDTIWLHDTQQEVWGETTIYEEATMIYFENGIYLPLILPLSLRDEVFEIIFRSLRSREDILEYNPNFKFPPSAEWEDIVVTP